MRKAVELPPLVRVADSAKLPILQLLGESAARSAPMTTATQTCRQCGEEKAVTEFNFKDKRRGRRQVYCRECTREQVRLHYQAHQLYYVRKARKRTKQLRQAQRKWIWDYLELHPCLDCGEADPCCLDFDHVRGKKVAPVSRMISNGYSWGAIEKEIRKCEVRCANCHRKRHAKRRKEWHPPMETARP